LGFLVPSAAPRLTFYRDVEDVIASFSWYLREEGKGGKGKRSFGVLGMLDVTGTAEEMGYDTGNLLLCCSGLYQYNVRNGKRKLLFIGIWDWWVLYLK